MKSGWMATIKAYALGSPARTSTQLEDDIQDEIAFHLQCRADDFVDQGLDVDEAQAAATKKFGDVGEIAKRCHSASMTGVTWMHRVHMGVTCCLLLAVAALTFQVAADRVLQVPPGIATMLDDDWTGDVLGQVVSDEGQPIANADILVAIKTWPDGSYFQRAYSAKTMPDGSFVIKGVRPVDDQYDVQIAVVAKGRVLRSQYRHFDAGESHAFAFQLAAADRIRFRVETSEGEPLSGAQLVPHVRHSDGGQVDLIYFDTAKPIIKTTDEEGLVELSCYQAGDGATLMVRDHSGAWEKVSLTIPLSNRITPVRI